MPYTLNNMNQHFDGNFNVYVNPKGKRMLHPGFRPGPYDVICARGKQAFDHEGNKRFRAIVKMNRDAYADALTKYHKSQIVSKITCAIRHASPDGGFVKLINNRWHEVGDRTAKEKIGQTFRDLLDQQYSSSTKAKARARIQRRVDTFGSDSPDQSETSKQDEEEEAENMSTVSVVTHESTSERNKKDSNSTPDHVEIVKVEPPQEPSLFDTFSQLIDNSQASDDFEPLPLDYPTFIATESDHAASSDDESLDELQDICDYVGVSC
ncbi:Nitrilase family, member 2 [Seminavis robusta]|uniref:Nitrilase family, member 2 n=1 Tax=Seminavis robusta TaxID=568900 RepID=A0A9N8DV95_9STRA|nr:Nitrilase family, member 2 [Seminavis robusta]|eukprot:Sro387_g132150.1 Nitrilase family, member 2 (266) ;mRNA; r:48863-49756